MFGFGDYGLDTTGFDYMFKSNCNPLEGRNFGVHPCVYGGMGYFAGGSSSLQRIPMKDTFLVNKPKEFPLSSLLTVAGLLGGLALAAVGVKKGVAGMFGKLKGVKDSLASKIKPSSAANIEPAPVNVAYKPKETPQAAKNVHEQAKAEPPKAPEAPMAPEAQEVASAVNPASKPPQTSNSQNMRLDASTENFVPIEMP